SATMMMFFKKEAKAHVQSPWVMALLGTVVGSIAGLLGVGGGNMLLPILILLGFEPKKVAVAVSFVVPFSAFTSFLSYASFVQMDWPLLGICTLGAVTGGYIGNYMMHFKLSQQQIKRVIAVILYILAARMAFNLLT
ncbi:sulfite exporter TauE/SafE family protein, partial [Hydrogenimonas sp.]